MGSTGEPDRKRRHFSSLSPTSAAAVAAKKPPFFRSSSSEDKKLDVAVLKYQNLKLAQQLQVQKVEFTVRKNKFLHVQEKQKSYMDVLSVVNKSWVQVVRDLEMLFSDAIGCSGDGKFGFQMLNGEKLEKNEADCQVDDDFLSRILETGATDSCSDYSSPDQLACDLQTSRATAKNVLQSIVSFTRGMWVADKGQASTLVTSDLSRDAQKTSSDLREEIQNLRLAFGDLHLKHRILGCKIQDHRDMDAKNRAEHNCLSEELKCTVAELEETNNSLAALRSQRDSGQAAPFFFPALGNKQVGGNKFRDKQKVLQDMDSAFREYRDLASDRLAEINKLQEGRIEILNKLAHLQNTLMDTKSISASKISLSLLDQLVKSKSEMDHFRTLLEKLQVEKDGFVWTEKEMSAQVDQTEVSRRFAAISETRIAELEQELCRLCAEKVQLQAKIEEASRESGRHEIIAEFKKLVASLPKDTELMQSELGQYKDAAVNIHSLRAQVKSCSSCLHRTANDLEALSSRSEQQLSEIEKLHGMVRGLRESDEELKLILEMYRRESTDTREVMDTRDMEFRAWALVQSLKSALDEHSLELRVKAANEAEAMSQQRLASAEAEIADLRQKLEASGRDVFQFSEILKSKHEESEAYLSEIESIGQAYEDMQTQNQHLLQQITDRDDYNIKLVMEGVKARHLQDALHMEIQSMDKEIKQANAFIYLYDSKVGRIEDQLKIWSEQIGKLVDDGRPSSVALETVQGTLSNVQRESQQLRQSFDDGQTKVSRSRLDVAGLLIDLEVERFHKKRMEEELEVLTMKTIDLKAQTEKSTVLQKLRQELQEYKGILKCNICHNRQKEVVIAKCYHLFCRQCALRTAEGRHRKCPTCNASFGMNDVKPIYI